MLQIARDKTPGSNWIVIGYDLEQDETVEHGEKMWKSPAQSGDVEICDPRKFMKATGIKLKPGEGPYNIKIVRDK